MTMKPLKIGILLFNDFELLDVCGPAEMFGSLPNYFNLLLISEHQGLVPSHQQVTLTADYSFTDELELNVLLIPGGMGTRKEINNIKLIEWIKQQAQAVELITSVCTGAALLAKAGVLDHRRATSNKRAFDWVKQQGRLVRWVDAARWVDDGNIITSSGVAAGIDMSLHVIEKLVGRETALDVANQTEYQWNQDAELDPFAIKSR